MPRRFIATYLKSRRSDLIMIAFFLVLSLVLALLDLGPKIKSAAGEKARARVLEVDNRQLDYRGMLAFGHQTLKLKIDAGEHRGRVFTAHNQLNGRTDTDKIFAPGDEALAAIPAGADPDRTVINAQDHYRIGNALLLFCLFALLLLAFGGLTGLKALISFVFTCLVIWKVIVPLCLDGFNPIMVSMLAVSGLCAAIIFIVAGVNAKGWTAFCGAFLGVLASCVMAILFTGVFQINGAVMPYSQPLFFAGYGFLDLTGLYIGAIFLASSGAVMDLAMDVAAGMAEVKRENPAISRRALIASGFRIGRMVVGTMTTTLLLAYSGGYLTLIMTFAAEGVGAADFLNYPYVAAELVKTIIGSFGLVLVAPFTAVIGGFILAAKTGAEKSA